MHKLNVGAKVNVLAGIEVSAAANAVKVSCVRGGRGLQHPGLKQTSHDSGRDQIMGFQVNVFVNGANGGVDKEGSPL